MVPCFHKAWALTSTLDSAGTSTCPNCPTNIAALFTFLSLPSWDPPMLSVPPSASPLSYHTPASVLSPCTVQLLILVSYVIALGTRDWASRVPHSFAASSWRFRTRPPFRHDTACSIKTSYVEGHRDVLRHQPISEAKIIPEFLQR